MLSDERGVSTVEYLIVLALVALASLGVWTWLGGNVDREVRCTAGAIGGSGAGGCRPEGARGGGPIAAAPDLARDDLGALIAEGTPPAQRARIEEALSSLPESVVSALLAQGTTIVAARGGVSDGAEELSAVRPRGWP